MMVSTWLTTVIALILSGDNFAVHKQTLAHIQTSVASIQHQMKYEWGGWRKRVWFLPLIVQCNPVDSYGTLHETTYPSPIVMPSSP